MAAVNKIVEDSIHKIQSKDCYSLNLSEAKIGDDGVVLITKALEKNTNITKLVLNCNNIGNTGAAAIAKMLAINTTIKILDLGYNNIGTRGLRNIFSALQSNKTLRVIVLGANSMSIASVQIVAAAIEKNYTPEALCLTDNGFGLVGTLIILKALLKNKSLKVLALSDNKIGETGAYLLAKILEDNHNLIGLHLYECAIGDKGGEAFAKALSINRNLKELGLGDNLIKSDVISKIFKALEYNKSLNYFCFSFCNLPNVKFTQSLQDQVIKTLKKNHTLAELDNDQCKICRTDKFVEIRSLLDTNKQRYSDMLCLEQQTLSFYNAQLLNAPFITDLSAEVSCEIIKHTSDSEYLSDSEKIRTVKKTLESPRECYDIEFYRKANVFSMP